MIQKAAGMRVYAVRDSTDTQVFLVGFGVYQGMLPVYGRVSASDAEQRRVEREIRRHDEKPIDVRAVLKAKRSYLMSDEQIEQQATNYEQRHEQEKQLPMAERVRLRLAEREVKPCIFLDSGFIVWGFDVLWGSEKRWERYRHGREIVSVSPPYGALRWRKEEENHDHNAGRAPAPDGQAHDQVGVTESPRRHS